MKLTNYYAAAAIAALTASASAATIGINFMNGQYADNTGVGSDENTAALDAALSVSSPAWNNHAIAGTGASTTATVAGIGMTLYRSGTWSGGSEGVTAGGDASQQVFRMYLEDGDGGGSYADGDGIGASIHLTGLTDALGGDAYRVHVLFSSDTVGASFAGVTLYDGEASDPATVAINSLTSLATGTATVAGNGTYPVASGAGTNEGGARGFVTFGGADGFTANNLVIAADDRDGSARGSIAGIVIETVPEPSSTALLGLGGLALILRRRK